MSLNRFSLITLLAVPAAVFMMTGCGSDAYVKDGDSDVKPAPPKDGASLSKNMIIDTIDPVQYILSVCDQSVNPPVVKIGTLDNGANQMTQLLHYLSTDGKDVKTAGYRSEPPYYIEAGLTQNAKDGYVRLAWSPNDNLGKEGYLLSVVEVVDSSGELVNTPIELKCDALRGNYNGIAIADLGYPITGKDLNQKSHLHIKASAYVHTDDGSQIIPPVVGPDGSIWLRHNLGANYITVGNPYFNPDAYPKSRRDENAYGDLYQWGRRNDGHQKILHHSATYATPASGITNAKANEPINSLFIAAADDWRVNSDDTLWRDINTPNQVCPRGWRLGTDAEWLAIRGADGTSESTFAAPDFMYLTLTGARIGTTGDVGGQGLEFAKYWTSTVRNNKATTFWVGGTQGASNSRLEGVSKTTGGPVRCRYGK